MKNRTLWIWLVALCLTGAAPSRGVAQGTIIHACYIPAAGAVYRIKEPGLPQACLAPPHVEFQWNAQGLKGDKGDPGVPGTFGLAGQSCPSGYFLAGFTSAGGLVCRDVNGQQTTPPPPANALFGTWTFSPQLISTCSVGSGSIPVAASGMVTSGTATSLSIQLTATAAGTTVPVVTLGPFTITNPPTYPINISASGTDPVNGQLTGSVTYNFSGQFTSATSFTGSFSATFNLFNGAQPLNCTPISGSITGTKQ